MKNLILAIIFTSPLAFSSVLSLQPQNLPAYNQKALGLAQGLTRKFEQSPRGSTQAGDPEGLALVEFMIASIAHPLFLPVSLTVCGLKIASPQRRSALDPTKITDVAAFNSAFTIIAVSAVAEVPGSDRLNEQQLVALMDEAYSELIVVSTRGCIKGFSQASALKAQREGKVSTFQTDFTAEIVDASKKIIADWEKADPKANETYQKEHTKILTELIEKSKGGEGEKPIKGILPTTRNIAL